ncbi:TPR-like protein [Laetiporus sulphureus 93-53]|uniref:TPR-like protein n=1 Tax=Laetiporus sulphureus 93-53 TaxID=1314785 RepID=A0A165E557_9APHY|nr:TPR-like protein [Laetiporus sulphureus 93-53]KZT06256.1 TPR-like protein [Laetiporus sulphureus 93-53]
MSDDAKTALDLKAEGNALYIKQDYAAAYKKYSDAIAIDDKNAVLYANRAACSVGLKRLSDAVADAQKATDIDPSYAKAWARLATAQDALGHFEDSVKSWKKALGALPAENMSAVEVKQKQHYESELQNTVARTKPPSAADQLADRLTYTTSLDTTPWARAKAMLPELERRASETANSSAWAILGAATDWESGLSGLKQLKKFQTAAGPGIGGMTNVLRDLSNALLRDPRIFHIDSPTFLQMYNDQVMFEAQKDRAWVTGDAQEIIADAPERQRKEGWTPVRMAITTTVRAWIMHAFVMLNMKDDVDGALKLYTQVLAVLQWGRQAWRDVKKDDRGVIFEDTFLRGVRSLYMEALMTACERASSRDSEDLLNTLLEEAQDILRDTSPLEAAVPKGESYDCGFLLSFVFYPRGHALSMVGFYHNRIARQFGMRKDAPSAQEHFAKAANAYLEAALMFPEDDEMHAWFLHVGLEALFLCGTPIRDLLPVMKRIRLALPKMKAIWEHSSMAQGGRDKALQKDVWGEEDLLKALQEGRFTLDDMIMPEAPQPR